MIAIALLYDFFSFRKGEPRPQIEDEIIEVHY